MVSKGHLDRRNFLAQVEENEGEDEAKQISDEMYGIRDDGDGVGDDPRNNLPSYKDKRYENDNNEFFVTLRIVLLRRRIVQFLLIPFLLNILTFHSRTPNRFDYI
jgi:hypothetical protein